MAAATADRLQVLDKTLGSGTRYTTNELIQLIEERTKNNQRISLYCLAKDLGIIKKRCKEHNVGDMVERSGPKGSRRYGYSKKGATVFPKVLTEEDLFVLQLVKLYLEKMNKAELYSQFERFLQKQHMEPLYAHLDDPSSYVQVHRSVLGKGLKHFSTLLHHILEGDKQLLITYKKSLADGLKKYFFSPYFLKESPVAWFVVGMAEVDKGNKLLCLSLNRIISIEETKKQAKPCTIERTDYFKDCIGINRQNCYDAENNKPVPVHLKFSKFQAPYLLEEPLHHSQSEPSICEDDSYVFTYCLIPNFELCQKILGYGNQVEVLSPQQLRDYIIEQINSAFSLYNRSIKKAINNVV